MSSLCSLKMLHWISISLRKKSRLVAMPMLTRTVLRFLCDVSISHFPHGSSSSFLLPDCSRTSQGFCCCLFVFQPLRICVCSSHLLSSIWLALSWTLAFSYLFCYQWNMWFRTHDRLSSYFTVLCPYCLFPHLALCIWAGTKTSMVLYIVFPTTMPPGAIGLF